jgi:hypothetical protein
MPTVIKDQTPTPWYHSLPQPDINTRFLRQRLTVTAQFIARQGGAVHRCAVLSQFDLGNDLSRLIPKNIRCPVRLDSFFSPLVNQANLMRLYLGF